jgi:hypothetical protein
LRLGKSARKNIRRILPRHGCGKLQMKLLPRESAIAR